MTGDILFRFYRYDLHDGKLAVKVSLGSLHPAAFQAVTVNWYTSQGEPSSVPLKLKRDFFSSPELMAPLVFRLVTLTK